MNGGRSAKQVLYGGPALYGILLACVGAGAVGGALLMPPLRRTLGADRLVAAGTLGTAGALVALAIGRTEPVAAAACLVAGGAWIAVLSSLHVSAQTALPEWVRARGLSVFLMVFFGSMAFGSVVWGQAAALIGVPGALLAAAAGAVLAIPLTRHARLGQGETLDLSPSMHWPAPVLSTGVETDRGPVMVTVEYEIAADDREAFLDAVGRLGRERRRDGAYDWGVFEDSETPGRWVEYFLLDSWLEHLRQHDRVTEADRAVQETLQALHRGAAPPQVRHLIAP